MTTQAKKSREKNNWAVFISGIFLPISWDKINTSYWFLLTNKLTEKLKQTTVQLSFYARIFRKCSPSLRWLSTLFEIIIIIKTFEE